jgi:type I restriction enzyme S subunit
VWPTVTLDDVKAPIPKAITDGPFGSNLTSAHYVDDGPQVVRLGNIGDGVYKEAPAHITWQHFENLRKHEALPGDLLVASLGENLPRACLMPSHIGPAIVKADCIRVRLSDNVDPRWVMYSMQRPQVRKWAEDHLHGVGRPRLGLKTIRQIPIPLPPVGEQQRIVEILEDHLSRIDAAGATIARQIERVGVLRLSRLQEDRSGIVAAGAPIRRIDSIATTALGKMLDAKRSVGRPTPYLRNINVRWGYVDTSDVLEVPLMDNERVRFALRAGDLLVCEGGEPGRCAVWEGSDSLVAYQKALHRVRADVEVIEPEFLAVMLEYVIRSGHADRLFTGTTIKHLPQEKLRAIEIPVPDLDTQRALIAELSTFEESVRRLMAGLEAAERRTELLRRSLLASAFSGQLTGSSTDIERIEEMAGV